MPHSVLVLDGTPRTIVAISRSLHRRGIPTICAQLDRSGGGLGSKAICADVAVTSRASFFDELAALVREYDIDTIFPCSDKALAALAPHYDELARFVHLSSPEPGIVAQVLNKEQSLAAAAQAGVPTPATYILSEPDEIRNVTDALRFPMIAKPAQAGAGGFKVARFDRVDQLDEFARSAYCRGRIVFQEFFAGQGVGVSTIVADDNPLVLFQHRRLHEYPPEGGVAVLMVSQDVQPELAKAAKAILRTLQWRGPAMVEFRHNAVTNQYVFMEVNGRFWGSLPVAAAAGLDFPYWQWQIMHAAQPDVPKSYSVGLTVRWTAGEIHRFFDLATNLTLRRRLGYTFSSSIVQFVGAFRPQIQSALFAPDDPAPEVRDVVSTVAALLASTVWRLARRVLPSRLTLPLDQARLLDPPDRKTYLARLLVRSLSRGGNRRVSLNSVRRVTFVCRANRIRSPLAAALFKSELAGSCAGEFQIRSAGTRTGDGTTFDARAQAAAAAMGLTLADRPQAVSAELVNVSQLIIAMDRVVEAELLARFPSAAGKIFLPGEMAGNAKSSRPEILDPDKSAQPEFERFVAELTASVRQLAQRIT